MGDSGSSAGSSPKGGLAADLVNEKGSRNKRKFLSDLSQDISTLSLTEFPRYEMLEEKFWNALSELGSMMEMSEDDPGEEQEEYLDADWDDPITCQLEELLTNNLFATFCSAVKKIIECGYTEEVAEWAVLNSNLFHGSKDAVSNVVDGALALLKREKEFNTPRHPVFEGLQGLVDYTLLEMIYVLREVRPGLTIPEAMWCLLISDLNLVNACMVEGGPSGDQEAPRVSPALSQSKPEASVTTSQSESSKLDKGKQVMSYGHGSQPEPVSSVPFRQLSNSKLNPGKESSISLLDVKGSFSGISREHIQSDEKMGSGRKVSSSNTKREMLRQKAFHFEKNYKGRMSKGAFQAKVATWGSMVLDKSLKKQSGMLMKRTYPKLTTSAGTSSEENIHPSGVPTAMETVIALPAPNTKFAASADTDQEPCRKGEISVADPRKATDYYASIPFDETLHRHIPHDNKDDTILLLLPHKEALEKEIQSWTDWANEKVMQAARRLGKDQCELKMLRQEKEEMEKYKKDKQTLEESTMKRLSEMENALSNATGQIEVANSTVRRLEEEQSIFKKDMEDAKLQALGSATKLQEAMLREQETLKKLQSWDTEKVFIQEKLTNVKRQVPELYKQLEKAGGRKNQFMVLLKWEEKEKLKEAKQIEEVRRKVEAESRLIEVEEESIRQMAKMNMQKCEEDIKSLGNMISELRLESEKSRIALLNVGYGSENVAGPKRLVAVFEDKFGVKPERECVMCMTDEISVVFLPCAHQVLCTQCSILHEKQGMNDCPSCRTSIQKRIPVSYRAH